MAQEFINIGGLANDGTGDPLRTAFGKINDNFTELYATKVTTVETTTVGNAANQVIFQTPISSLTQAKFQINSVNTDTQDSQNIILNTASINNGTDVKFSAYGTLFYGNAITTYNMDVSGGNVRLMCNPLVDATLTHFIAFQIMFTGTQTGNLALALDGYPALNYLTTENGLVLTIE